MGQKINPIGFRLAVNKAWSSKWYATPKDFPSMLKEDLDVRNYIKSKLKNAAVSKVVIERPAKNAKISIHSARPGIIIGKKGGDIEILKNEVNKILKVPVHLNIDEVRKPEIDAQLVSDSISQQLEKELCLEGL